MGKIPTVILGLLKDDSGKPIELDSSQWLEWLKQHSSFRYEPKSEESGFTARAEKSGYWYAYRKVAGKLHKRYMGKPEELTVKRLEDIARLLNEPQQPREEKVTQEKVAPKYATNEDVARLWEALGMLRLEVITGKAENPVVDDVAQDASVTDISVTELQKQIESLEIKLKLARQQKDELQEALAATERENHYLKNGVAMQKVVKELRQAQFELQGLRRENQELQKQLSNQTQPSMQLPQPSMQPSQPQTPSWESRSESFLSEVSWNG